VSAFAKGDRVFHRTLKRYGTYLERHNWGTSSPETSSYVLFDGDDEYPDGRPVSTDLLERSDEAVSR
jgi:hypothetical protein